MKILSVIFTLLLVTSVSGQEVEMPITHNQELVGKVKNVLKNGASFDSTFVFTTDTLTLPIFDDFSKNRIQTYISDYNDPTVTFDKKYRLLDGFDVPLPADVTYTTQVTFKRTYSTITGEFVDEPFAPTSIKVGSLSSYPVNYVTTNVYPPYYLYDTIGIPDVQDTIFIIGPDIYQDSATQFFQHVTGQDLFWLDDHAYHNYRYAIDPWSLGVMTFDGCDRTGYPYQMGGTQHGFADYLTSKPIDLSGSIPADSVYLTFLYQGKGFGDPIENGDSLVLEFFDVSTQTWDHAWATSAAPFTDFAVAQVVIDNAIYFTDAFQFRFKNYGSLAGILDNYHLDYVHLRDFSGYQDTLIEDFAMVYPTTTLLKDFTSVPWDHYKNNPGGKMSTETEVVVRNSYLNGGANISSSAGGSIEVKYGGTSEGVVALNGQTLANFNPPAQPIPDYQPRTTYHSFHDISTYSFDDSKVGTQQFFDIETHATVPVGSNYLPNDTAYSQQYFGNYYSYDDGTAESALGIQTQSGQPRIAIQYTPYEADSIIGMYVNFVPTNYDISNYLFQMTIWGDDNGEPGAIIYQDDPFLARQPQYAQDRDVFVKYMTEDTTKVPVSGTFYIGWKQIDLQAFTVGLDKNIDNKEHTFFSINGEVSWATSGVTGSVMIRPIFSTSLDPELGIEQKKIELPTISAFPNPNNGFFTIKSTGELGEIYVYSIRGELILKTQDSQIDLSNQPSGMYFVSSSTNFANTIKVIKN